MNKADGLLQTALHEREALPAESGKTLADNRIALGLLRADEDKPQEGERLVRQAIQTLAQRESGNQLLIARANSALGQVLLAEGKFPEGVELLKQAAAVQESMRAPSTDLAETLSVLAEAYLYQGKDYDADAVNQQLLTLERRIYGGDDPHLSDVLSNLGETAEERGNYAQAESYERQGLHIAEAFYGREHPETASFMTTLAGTLVYESKYAEASQLLQGALTTQEKVYGLRSPQVAYVLNKTGMLAQQQNDLKTAIRDDLRSYEIYRSSYGDGDYRVGLAMANVGSVYLPEKQYAQADKSFTDALGLLRKERSDDSVDTAIVHIKLGRTLLFESRYREAEAQTRGGYEVLLKQASHRRVSLRPPWKIW